MPSSTSALGIAGHRSSAPVSALAEPGALIRRQKTGRSARLNRITAAVTPVIEHAEQRLNGHGRLVVRPSGTEPVIRVMGEGDDKVLVEAVVDDVVEALTEVAA